MFVLQCAEIILELVVPRIQDENLESQGRGGHGKIGHRDKARDSHRVGQAIAGDVTKSALGVESESF